MFPMFGGIPGRSGLQKDTRNAAPYRFRRKLVMQDAADAVFFSVITLFCPGKPTRCFPAPPGLRPSDYQQSDDGTIHATARCTGKASADFVQPGHTVETVGTHADSRYQSGIDCTGDKVHPNSRNGRNTFGKKCPPFFPHG
jgi:hypothetical protein